MPQPVNEMNENPEQSPKETEFNLTDLPLGAIAACDVSDQPMWTGSNDEDDSGEAEGDRRRLSGPQENAIDAMRTVCAEAEIQSRRLEVELAWKLELMDRGFHYIYPGQNGGWVIQNPAYRGVNNSPFAQADQKSQWPLNVIGAKNDIIGAALTREIPRVEFFPKDPDDDSSITAADAANKYKHFLADQNFYPQRASEASRLFCTDERVVFYMRPVADAQQFGWEDSEQSIAPEAEDQGSTGGMSRKPRIREILSVYGKLSHKTQIVCDNNQKSPYEQIYEELDVSTARGMFPWIADKITGGDVGIAEVQLDRMARCSVKLALKGTYSTGDSLQRDTTVQRTWLRPQMYLDDTCPKEQREWFFQNFPKGCLVVYAGKSFAYCRNEGADEVLTIIHARTGQGQNRRAITESFAGPNLRLNNWNELLDQSFRKSIPRLFLDSKVFNVPALRAAAATVGAIDPFSSDAVAPGMRPSDMMFQTPVASISQAVPDAMQWYFGPLAEELTGAQPSLAGSEDEDNPETLGQSRLQNAQAMSRLAEPYQALRYGFANSTRQGVMWASRIQPPDTVIDRMIGGKRVTVKIADMGAEVYCYPEGDANIPESWEERKAMWGETMSAAEANPNGPSAQIVGNPLNAAKYKQFYPPGTVIPGVDAVEKQQGEFEVLLETAPLPNPQYLQLDQMVQQGTAEMQAMQAMGVAPDPQKQEALQQAQQQLQNTPQQISSVPLRASDNDAVEALVCLDKLNSPEGRRLANSRRPKDQMAYQNLTLHWQQHDARAKQNALANAQGIPPKVSINVAADKLTGPAQQGALAKAGIPSPPNAGDAMTPHEEIVEQEHIDPMTGSKVKIRQSSMNPEQS